MARQSELETTIAFLRRQRWHVKNYRQFKKRLAQFGFGIDGDGQDRAVVTLPQRQYVCALAATRA